MVRRDVTTYFIAPLFCTLYAVSPCAQELSGSASVIPGGFREEFGTVYMKLKYQFTDSDGGQRDTAGVRLTPTPLTMHPAYLDGSIRVVPMDGQDQLLREIRGFYDNAWYPGRVALPIRPQCSFQFKYGALSEYYNTMKDRFTYQVGEGNSAQTRLEPKLVREMESWIDSDDVRIAAEREGDCRHLFTCLNQIYAGMVLYAKRKAQPVESPEGITLSEFESLRIKVLDRLRETAQKKQVDWDISLAQYIVAHAGSPWTSRGDNYVDPTIGYFKRLDALQGTSDAAQYAEEVDALVNMIQDYGWVLWESKTMSISEKAQTSIESFSRRRMITEGSNVLSDFIAGTEEVKGKIPKNR